MSKKFLLVSMLVCTLTVLKAFEISSIEPIEYTESAGELIARGDAKISVEDFVIQADEIRFQKEKSMAIASGNVKIDNGKYYAIGDYLYYDLQNDIAHAESAKVSVDGYYFFAKNVDIFQDRQTGSDGTVFFSDPSKSFAPSIVAKNFTIKGNVLRAEGTKLKIGRIPVLYLPGIEVEMSDRPFFAEQNFGIDKSSGIFLQNDVYIGIKDGIKFGGMFDVYTRRGFLFGPALKLKNNSPDNCFATELKIAGISDKGGDKVRGTDVLGDQISKRRGFIEFSHRQHYGDKIDIISRVQYLSDSEVERDFRKSWYEDNQRADSFAEVAYRGENYIISAFGRFQPNKFFPTTRRLPEVRVDYLPTKVLDTDLVHNAHLSIAGLRGIDKLNLDEVNSFRSDAYYGVSLPLVYDDFVTVKPILGTRGILYHGNSGDKTKGKALIQGGVDVDFKFYGQWDYCNETFGIDGLKHTINPVIQYRVIPSDNIRDDIPWLDTDFFNVEIPSIDLGDMRNVDNLPKQNMLRVGVRNNLYTKSGNYTPRKLMRFDVLQDVLFRQDYDRFSAKWQKKFQNTHLLLGIYPVEWLNFDAYGRIDPANGSLRQLKISTSIHDGDFWEATFTTNYLNAETGTTNQCAMKFTFNLSSLTSLSIEEHYDAQIRKFTSQRFSVSTTLWDSWRADIGITLREMARREDRVQFNWHIKLLDF
ncbi:MAG: hypothetical protein LBR91_03355 [Puniceicoccales bacterium]|nr:hypothetical protein [Puniceicoccales bacterium]